MSGAADGAQPGFAPREDGNGDGDADGNGRGGNLGLGSDITRPGHRSCGN